VPPWLAERMATMGTAIVEDRYDPSAGFKATIAHENAISREYGGRSVFDDRKKKSGPPKSKQLYLFDC
jgi:hypothetical protein